jgi:hypothetical protein
VVARVEPLTNAVSKVPEILLLNLVDSCFHFQLFLPLQRFVRTFENVMCNSHELTKTIRRRALDNDHYADIHGVRFGKPFTQEIN